MTSAIDDRDVDSRDIQFMMIPIETNGRRWIDTSNDAHMAALGRSVVQLLLTQAPPKTPPALGAVDVKKNIDAPAVVEKVAQKVIAPKPPELPAAEEVKASPVPQLPPEADQKNLESYRQQIRLLMDAIKHERQLLNTQEKIQLLQQINSHGAIFIGEDPKIAIVNRIKSYERQIQEIQSKLDDPLHDIQG